MQFALFGTCENPLAQTKLYHLCTNEKEANELKSVDGTEYIFRNNHQKLNELKKLHSEVWNIYQEIEK